MFGLLRDVYKDSHQVITVRFTFMVPEAPDSLRLRRHGAELLLQLEKRVGDDIIGHRLAVIEPERQQDLVASE